MVNKSDNKNENPAITDSPIQKWGGRRVEEPDSARLGVPIAQKRVPRQFLFNGWCREGYWLNGQLLNRQEYKARLWPAGSGATNSRAQTVEKRTKFKSWRREILEKHRSRRSTKLPEASRGMSESQYHIPTLSDLSAL